MEATLHLLDLADAVGAGEPSPRALAATRDLLIAETAVMEATDRGYRGARRSGGAGRRRARHSSDHTAN